MTTEQTWERLCGLVAEDPAVLDDVREALAEGEDTAGVWQVFISGLDDAGELAYLKASDGPMELEAALAQLPRVVRAAVDLESVGDVDGDLAAGVDVAEEVLAEVDLATVHLPEDEDAHPLAVVVLSALDDAEALIEELLGN